MMGGESIASKLEQDQIRNGSHGRIDSRTVAGVVALPTMVFDLTALDATPEQDARWLNSRFTAVTWCFDPR
jgi:hypothetical protein